MPFNLHVIVRGGPMVTSIWALATKVRQNLSIVAKNENSTEHFVHLHADYLTPWGPNTLCELN